MNKAWKGTQEVKISTMLNVRNISMMLIFYLFFSVNAHILQSAKDPQAKTLPQNSINVSSSIWDSQPGRDISITIPVWE